MQTGASMHSVYTILATLQQVPGVSCVSAMSSGGRDEPGDNVLLQGLCVTDTFVLLCTILLRSLRYVCNKCQVSPKLSVMVLGNQHK